MKKITSIGRKVGRKLLPLQGAMSTLNYLRAVRSPPFRTTETEFFGKPFWFSNADGFFHSFAEIFHRRVYDFSTTTATPVIVDAGANIGMSVIFFKQLFPSSKIIALEPDPEIYALLVRNMESYNYDDVDLREAAVWINDHELSFYSEGSLSGSSQVDFRGAKDVKKVKAVRLKTLLAEIPEVDFLKIDIEGAEAEVLLDIESELHSVRNLFFEYHSIPGKQQVLGELLSLVTRVGFRYAISGAYSPPLPFRQCSTGAYDNQVNISCFRPI
jgi:FkbM family methyltransferase